LEKFLFETVKDQIISLI